MLIQSSDVVAHWNLKFCSNKLVYWQINRLSNIVIAQICASKQFSFNISQIWLVEEQTEASWSPEQKGVLLIYTVFIELEIKQFF